MLIKKGVIDWLFQYFAGQKKFQDYEGSNLCIVRFNRQLVNLNRFVNHILLILIWISVLFLIKVPIDVYATGRLVLDVNSYSLDWLVKMKFV